MNGPGSHPCPVGRCGVRVPASQLMCRTHWAKVPEPLRRAVYRTWARGAGAGSAGHRAAILAAVQAVETAVSDAV